MIPKPLGDREGARSDEPESEDLLQMHAQNFGGKRAANRKFSDSNGGCFVRLPFLVKRKGVFQKSPSAAFGAGGSVNWIETPL